MFECFTGQARRALLQAQREAQRLGHDYLGTEHILLGLLAEPASGVARRLRNFRVDVEAVRQQARAGCSPGTEAPAWEQLPLTPGAKRALAFATAEAESFHQPAVASEHLLLGLLIEDANSASDM